VGPRLAESMKLSRLVLLLLSASAAFGQQAAASTTPPPAQEDPKILEDGGLSIEPFYWLTQAQPSLFGGKTATADGNLDYSGKSKRSEGVEVGLPAGRANTLRFSYFRVQGDTNSTLGQDETIFSEAFSSGDYMASTYRLQSAKISWDYLSYTWQKSHVRFKTLYEVQYTTISTDVSAPFVPETTDSSGNTNSNSAHGSENLLYPTFGVEFEQPWKKYLRWEAKVSGFGLPHRAVIWDAQADVAFQIHSIDVFIGEKAYHFKTSPNGDQYFIDTLQGAYVGVRYYLGRAEN